MTTPHEASGPSGSITGDVASAPYVAASPYVTVVIPCFNEEGYIDALLDSMLPQLGDSERWRLVLVDDSSSDATSAILAGASTQSNQVAVVTGRYGSPGGARSAGVAYALSEGRAPDWLLTVDADVLVEPDWLWKWDASIAEHHNDPRCGAINGGEIQDHLYTDYPNARVVSAAFGHTLVTSERAVGITNLNGVNHGIRTVAYLTAGPYLQPTTPGPHGPLSLAGEDWDLGVRLRRAGFTVQETEAAVRDRGRRLLTDVHAYVSGEAYEGAFRRLEKRPPSQDIDASEVDSLVDGAIERSLRHFFLKPLLAGATPIDASTGLSESTTAAMQSWIQQWPHPTFEESRNGFIFGRLERFSHVFNEAVRRDLNLQLETVLPLLKGL